MRTFGTVPLVPVLRKFHFKGHVITPLRIKHPSTFLTGDLVQDRQTFKHIPEWWRNLEGRWLLILEQNINWYSSDWLSNESTLSSKEIWRCLFSQKHFRVKLCKWSKPFDIFGNVTFVHGAWNARKCDDLCSPYWLAWQTKPCVSHLSFRTWQFNGLPVLVLTLPVLRKKRIGFQPILVLPQSPLYYGYVVHVNALQT